MSKWRAFNIVLYFDLRQSVFCLAPYTHHKMRYYTVHVFLIRISHTSHVPTLIFVSLSPSLSVYSCWVVRRCLLFHIKQICLTLFQCFFQMVFPFCSFVCARQIDNLLSSIQNYSFQRWICIVLHIHHRNQHLQL